METRRPARLSRVTCAPARVWSGLSFRAWQPPLDNGKRLHHCRGDLPQAAALSAESTGVLHLRTQAPLLLPEPASLRAILGLVSSRDKRRATADALQNRSLVELILGEHVGEAGQQGGSHATHQEVLIWRKIQDRAHRSTQEVDGVERLFTRELRAGLGP